MADGKGFKVVVKVNLPPEVQFHSGHSVIFQGDSTSEVQDLIAPLVGDEQAKFILLRFAEYALGGAVQQALTSGAVQDAGPSGREGSDPAVLEPGSPGDGPAAPDLASEAVLKAVSKKTGKSLEELQGTTVEQAKVLLKGEK